MNCKNKPKTPPKKRQSSDTGWFPCVSSALSSFIGPHGPGSDCAPGLDFRAIRTVSFRAVSHERDATYAAATTANGMIGILRSFQSCRQPNNTSFGMGFGQISRY